MQRQPSIPPPPPAPLQQSSGLYSQGGQSPVPMGSNGQGYGQYPPPGSQEYAAYQSGHEGSAYQQPQYNPAAYSTPLPPPPPPPPMRHNSVNQSYLPQHQQQSQYQLYGQNTAYSPASPPIPQQQGYYGRQQATSPPPPPPPQPLAQIRNSVSSYQPAQHSQQTSPYQYQPQPFNNAAQSFPTQTYNQQPSPSRYQATPPPALGLNTVSSPSQYIPPVRQSTYGAYTQDAYNSPQTQSQYGLPAQQHYGNSQDPQYSTPQVPLQPQSYHEQSYQQPLPPATGHLQTAAFGGASASSYSHSSDGFDDGDHALPEPPPPPPSSMQPLQNQRASQYIPESGFNHSQFADPHDKELPSPPPPEPPQHGYLAYSASTALNRPNHLQSHEYDEPQHHNESYEGQQQQQQYHHNEAMEPEASYTHHHHNVAVEDHERMERQAQESLYSGVEQATVHDEATGTESLDEVPAGVVPLFASTGRAAPPAASSGHNGYHSYVPGNSSSDEAAGAWQAMRADEEREMGYHNDIAPTHLTNEQTQTPDEGRESPDYVMDMGGFSGGGMGFFGDDSFAPSFQLAGHDTKAPVLENYSSSTSQMRRSNTSGTNNTARTGDTPSSGGGFDRSSEYIYPNPFDDVLHPFSQFTPPAPARVDTMGTGGLQAPRERRNSFLPAEDEPEILSATSHSGMEFDDSDDDSYLAAYDQGFMPTFGTTSAKAYPSHVPGNNVRGGSVPNNAYNNNLSIVESKLKSSLSLNTYSSNSSYAAAHVSRSKTDASVPGRPPGPRSPAVRVNPASAPLAHQGPQPFEDGALAIDLPLIGKSRKFDPARLSSKEFRRCEEPWAISGVSRWLRTISEGEGYLREKGFAEAIVKLFTHVVATMNVADAETLAERVLKSMWDAGCLTRDEEWVRWNPEAQATGVIYQITGRGCYAPRVHVIEANSTEMEGRCYSHHCARTLKKFALGNQSSTREKEKEDWATFWKLKAADIEGVGKKEIERQNNLHEVVQTEQEYMDHMVVLKVVFEDQLRAEQSRRQIIKPARFDSFVKDVFGKAAAVRKANEEHLFPQLKSRQLEQGPWVVGFSDIFREWIRKARPAYIEYAGAFPKADFLMRREADRNMLFKTFLDQCRSDPRSQRLDWGHFLKNPITRLQRYSLLLSTILKHALTENDEKKSLQIAIEEIKAVTHECDARVDEMTKKVVLLELGAKLAMRPGMDVDLRLDEKGREVIYKGDLQRIGNNRFNWLETHAILFDHYLVLAKTVQQKDAGGKTKQEKYDVSRMPIPMDLLVLESSDDPGVIKNSATARLGLGATTKVAQVPQAPPRNNSTAGGTGPGSLQHTTSSLSVTSTASSNTMKSGNLALNDPNSDKIMYPFRIKHLGKAYKGEENTYTLYAPSIQARTDWCERIVQAKERHAASLFRQNAEPFRLRVMSDAAFGFDNIAAYTSPAPQSNVKGTPLDRSIKEVEANYPGAKPAVVSRSMVNCATAFHIGMGYGKQMIAIGTDAGVYVSDYDNPRGWTKAINNLVKVTQIAVLEEFSLFLVLADKTLIAYHLDAVVPPDPAGGVIAASAKRDPQKLSGSRDVGFFATGKMKDRVLVFYKRKEVGSSTFKVLEPVFQKATEKKSRFSRKGTTEFFREFDEFYIPTDCFGINLFHSSLSIQTQKGFEVMTLDKKVPWSIPELGPSHVQNIAIRVKDQKPLGMFRISDIEFLLCYEECGVYVSKHGDVSRSVIMEFVGKAKTCAHYPPYVLIFDADFIEIRNADNGRLRQVIAGRGAKCLDDGQSGGSAGHRTIKVVMVHPESEGRQLVMELLLNEGQTE